MKISIITVVMNAVDTIEDTLRSVATQTHPDVEHIVIDGGSTDGTLEIIERHRDCIALWKSEPDDGIYDAMNKGIELATGEVVGTLNADDVYNHDNVLTTVSQGFEDGRLEACYADLVYVDPQDMDQVSRYWRSCDYRPGLFERGWIPAHPTFFVRRSVYESLGSFDLQYRLHADTELTLRFLAVAGICSRYYPEIWVRMRTGGATNRSIGNILRGNLESYRACKAHGLKVTPLYFPIKFLSRLPQFIRRPKSGATD
ncbi:MAG: glycosyltransferase [Gammaproteobacteria bacterium]|nr:glycosyltransferase [Gammaproteobacteria bacterium]